MMHRVNWASIHADSITDAPSSKTQGGKKKKKRRLFSRTSTPSTTPTPRPDGTEPSAEEAALSSRGLNFLSAHGEGRRLAVREGLRHWQLAWPDLRRLVRLRHRRRRPLHVPHLGRTAGRTRAGGEAMPLPLRPLPRRCRRLPVAEEPPRNGGEEVDCAARGLDPGPGEARDPADPAGALLGGRGQCRPQLGLENLRPCSSGSDARQSHACSLATQQDWSS